MAKLTWPMRAALEYVSANEGRHGQACRLSRITEPTRQRLIDLGMMEPALVDADGDHVCITPAGKRALAENRDG